MMLSADDARTDVILVAATAVLGLTLRGFVSSLALYPRTGVVAVALDLAWIVVLTALVPWLLARHRGDLGAAFGLRQGGRSSGGLLLALPAVALGVAAQGVLGASGLALVLGRVSGVAGAAAGPLDLAVGLLAVALYSVGALVLVGFLAVRSRDAFPRSPDTSVTQLVRTLGLGAVGVSLVTGLLRALGPGSFALLGLNLVALAAVLLLADRLVPARLQVPRTTVVAPLIVVSVAHVFAAGGLFRGDLLGALYLSGLAAGATVAICALSQTRAGVATAVPLVVAVHWWPTCLSPLTFAGGLC